MKRSSLKKKRPHPRERALREAQRLLFFAIVFVAARELLSGVPGQLRIDALWALAAAPVLLAAARPREAYGARIDLAALVQIGLAGLVVAMLLVTRAVDASRGLLAQNYSDAALVGALSIGCALMTWGAASRAAASLSGNAIVGALAGAALFTIAFFAGNLAADGLMFAAAAAGSLLATRTGNVAFGVFVFAFGAAGLPGAGVALAGYLIASFGHARLAE